MTITDLVSITQLSRLTHRSRPTIYKYLNEYESAHYNNVPSSFFLLFQMAETASLEEIIEYCNEMFGSWNSECEGKDPLLGEIVDLLIANSSKLDLQKIKEHLLEEIKHG